MTFSKSKERKAAEGPSRLRVLIDSMVRRFGADMAEPFVKAIKREARAALRRRPKLKRPRGRYHRPGPGGGWKLRKRVVRLGGCPTDHSLDRKWHLNKFKIAERERANAR